MNIRLDNRVIEGKMPLTWFDADKAKEFIGKTGYFSDNLICFKNIDNLKVDVLTGVDDDLNEEEIYQTNTTRWIYFLPDEWVKSEEPEKKYRPLSYKEFWRLFDLGDGVCFRRKGQDTAEFSMFLGYEIDSDGNRAEIPGEGKVNLGGNRYTLAELFEYYELELDDEWQPFGVIDE